MKSRLSRPLLLSRLYALLLVCALHTASVEAEADTAALQSDTSAAPPLQYVFHPAYQPTGPARSALNYSLVPFNIRLGTRRVTGRVVTVHSAPQLHFSVYPPPAGCGGGRSSVSHSAAYWGCDVAMNAGFFQIDQPAGFCLNAVVSDGRLVQEQAQYSTPAAQDEAGQKAATAGGSTTEAGGVSSDSRSAAIVSPASSVPAVSAVSHISSPPSSLSTILPNGGDDAAVSVDPSALFAHHNVHFGVTSDGRYFVGHINHSLLARHSDASTAAAADTWHFTQLLSGVVWLVRDGVSHVQQSWQQEEDQSTPIPAASFPTMMSARTAIGHDSSGRLMLVLVEGKSGESGVSLKGLAELCVRVAMVNGINTDGGGSATLVEHGVLVNEPSESSCPNAAFDGQTCERPVASIACLHASRRVWTDTAAASGARRWLSQLNALPSIGSCEWTGAMRLATCCSHARVTLIQLEAPSLTSEWLCPPVCCLLAVVLLRSECVAVPVWLAVLLVAVACLLLAVLAWPACRVCAVRYCARQELAALQAAWRGAAARTGWMRCWHEPRPRDEEEVGLMLLIKSDI